MNSKAPAQALGGLLAGALATFAVPARAADDLASALAALRGVAAEGRGNVAASAAWAQLGKADASHLPAVFAAMDGASDLARNWLFAAADSIADRSLAAGAPLPLPALGAFLLDSSHDPKARRLSFDLIARADTATAETLIAGLLDDPSPELRRESVQRVVDRAAKNLAEGRKDAASLLYQQSLAFARDADQIEAVTKPLRELGRPVNLVEHLGFLTQWKVIGPFDNTGGAGFDKPFPPETELRFDAEYDGKEGKVRWKDFASNHEMGMVDFNKAYAPIKEVTGYAYAEFHSEAPRPAEIRLGCKNGWKIWFNGQYLFGRDEYHRGAELDQYKLPVQLRPGKNTLLVKLTQNEQKEDWTIEWEYQLRITDPSGRVIRSTPAGFHAAATPANDRI
ncbi:MAG: hypothetical protein JNL97_01095 [Verrucomicrobiales bacterium]|nr:hypothetical protein [Verrucomicrobiales bacterium]